jgi:hypothetical protein
MSIIPKISYRDMVQAESDSRVKITLRKEQLEKIKQRGRGLTPQEINELARLKAVADALNTNEELCEKLFVGVRDLFNANAGLLGRQMYNHIAGVLNLENKDFTNADEKSAADTAAPCLVALTYGLLAIGGAADTSPEVLVGQGGASRFRIIADISDANWPVLSRMFFAAVGEARSFGNLALAVLPLLAKEGDTDGFGGNPPVVYAAEFAKVMRYLAKAGISDPGKVPQLRRYVNEALDVIQNRAADGTETQLGIDLPDLEDAAEAGLVPDNIRLMGPMICAAMFDELKAFEVVDKLVELFQQGMLTIGNGTAGVMLYKYWKDAPNRMSEAERKNFYAMTMGVPGGETTANANREFNDLWLRFVSSVSAFVRQYEVDKLLRANLPAPINHQQVRKAARDLAVNLSLHGYGMAYHAALDLQGQIKFMVNLLGDPEIKANYGARDMWQVVDQVATLELGGAKTSSRYRTLATCGAIITAWLANNSDVIRRAGGSIIDMDEVRQPRPRMDGTKATTTPTDADLVNACELWLADTATGDTVIDQMAQPKESPVMTSRPVQIPSIAREMLADLPGVSLGFQNTRH